VTEQSARAEAYFFGDRGGRQRGEAPLADDLDGGVRVLIDPQRDIREPGIAELF